ncbi:PP2C family protein-serine/threonine phosphatase [Streptomyces sp. NPDC005899]|uniref:PP2C family protein-serine/threonine phosphatase n=1 Tax=Streptomyces sp. NPDC005899 TaxID=3155716 RepID=UPI0033F21774
MPAGLLTDSHVLSFEYLPGVVARHAAVAGFTDVLTYLGDLQRDVLRLVTGSGLEAARKPGGQQAEILVEGTVAGRAYQYGSITVATGSVEGAYRWWVPLLDGTERVGVLHLGLATDDEDVREAMFSLASLVAMLVAGARDTSDSLARLSRTKPMNVAAEMQWQLMAPRTYADGNVAVAAVMEPAYEVSGDTYDYATAGDAVHLSLFDAMGHDTAAGLTANSAMGACRNSRRQGTSLAGLGDAIEQVLLQEFRAERWVTGILADLDTTTGVLTWTNRGHLPPVVICGGRWTSLLDCPPAHPMGSDFGLPTVLCREQLQPGDRLVLYTEGITEARNAAGEEFGEDAFRDFLVRHHSDSLPVAETLRRLMRSLLAHHDGDLQDDATIVLCEWFGPTSRSTPATASVAGLPQTSR